MTGHLNLKRRISFSSTSLISLLESKGASSLSWQAGARASLHIFFPLIREAWADYFEQHKIQYAFFSAANGIAIQEERARLAAVPESEDGESSSEEDDIEDEESEEEEIVDAEVSQMKIPKTGNKLNAPGPSQGKANVESEDEDDYDDEDDEDLDSDEELAGKMQRGAGISTPGSDEPDRTRILSVLELEDLFLKQAPEG